MSNLKFGKQSLAFDTEDVNPLLVFCNSIEDAELSKAVNDVKKKESSLPELQGRMQEINSIVTSTVLSQEQLESLELEKAMLEETLHEGEDTVNNDVNNDPKTHLMWE